MTIKSSSPVLAKVGFVVRLLAMTISLLSFCVLLSLDNVAAGEISAPSEVAQFSTWEVRFDSSRLAPASGVYRPETFLLRAEIRKPSGASVSVDAFPYQAFKRTLSAAGKEVLTPQGRPTWRLRYTPDQLGEYAVRFIVRRERTSQTLTSVTFRCLPAAKKPDGFLRVNPNLPTQFAFDSGKGYFAIGHNVCWVSRDRGTYQFEAYYKKMAAAGENFTRLWLCTWGISLDANKPYTFDLADAWRLDHILQVAAKRGIYVKLCLDNFFDFRERFSQSPFAKENGGPCASQADFFTSEVAKTQYRARLRFLVARYGSYRSLLAWELWNEANYALNYSDVGDKKTYRSEKEIARDYLIPWMKEMAATTRRLDPYKHLITTSLGNYKVSDALWRLREMSFAQYHAYLNYFDYYGPEGQRDSASVILKAQALMSVYNKPALIAEFGFIGDSTDSSRSAMNQKDPTGIHLHNALWAGTFSGGCGTPMLWWWDNYIEPRNLYYHYKGLSNFLKDVDWAKARVPMREENSSLRVLALRGADETLFWVQNLQGTWYNRLVRQVVPKPLKGVILTFKNFPRGRYKLTWYDTQRGVDLSTYELSTSAGKIRLKVPAFTLDVAAKLKRLAP